MGDDDRSADEVLRPLGTTVGAPGAAAFNPAFDVTPARLVRGIVTEHGVIQPVTRQAIREVLGTG